MAGDYEHIRAALSGDDGSILEIVLASPKGNVLGMAMMKEIGAALNAHRDRASLKAVLLRAEGKHFSFGASVAEHQRDQAAAMLEGFHDLARELVAFPVPIVSMVQGRCLGGAFEVVLCSHVVLAMDGAVFACPEIHLGVFPPVLAAIGHLRLGGALAERLLLTGANLGVAQAQACGFVAEVYDRSTNDGEPADPRALALAWIAEHFGPRSAFSLRQATRATRAGSGMLAAVQDTLDGLEKQYIDNLVPSHDGNEGITAFLERRRPNWLHR